ncbi:Protein of unknown function [Bacillus mycoides]|uniref:Uncharacterized protein n=1 Tax=Bacillus mycoides TaxID=1405 RepID=A0A1C4CBN0_BACMY|nr:Protein of unknown function [Bacillus mycoides]SCC16520.1 Protein of unknown function [Bacillus mycoides]SCM85342.1 Protein of unknown function [Bacillus mycoides]
MPLDYISGN